MSEEVEEEEEESLFRERKGRKLRPAPRCFQHLLVEVTHAGKAGKRKRVSFANDFEATPAGDLGKYITLLDFIERNNTKELHPAQLA